MSCEPFLPIKPWFFTVHDTPRGPVLYPGPGLHHLHTPPCCYISNHRHSITRAQLCTRLTVLQARGGGGASRLTPPNLTNIHTPLPVGEIDDTLSPTRQISSPSSPNQQQGETNPSIQTRYAPTHSNIHNNFITIGSFIPLHTPSGTSTREGAREGQHHAPFRGCWTPHPRPESTTRHHAVW